MWVSMCDFDPEPSTIKMMPNPTWHDKIFKVW